MRSRMASCSSRSLSPRRQRTCSPIRRSIRSAKFPSSNTARHASKPSIRPRASPPSSGRRRRRGPMSDQDPHDEIERLEQRIEELAAKIEGCRKLGFAGRVAIAAGTVLLLATDIALMAGGMAALLGGIVLAGSNRSTAQEAAGELVEAEAERAALIETIRLTPVMPSSLPSP